MFSPHSKFKLFSQASVQFAVADGFSDMFGHEVIIAAYIILLKKVRHNRGLDYLQVFEIDGERLWFIDDISHVTYLLPEDY
jgi:hypothetical protein